MRRAEAAHGHGWRFGAARRSRNISSSDMASWIPLFVLSLVTSDVGVLGRAVDTLDFLSQPSDAARDASGSVLRTDALRRWRRGVAETHRERCAELAAPWQENTRAAPEDTGTVLRLRVRPAAHGASRGLVFPGKPLFSFVRRVYSCCQQGLCRSVKGIQGRARAGTDVEFHLTRDILSLNVLRAELHLQLSNPQHLEIRPVLPPLAKRDLPTRFTSWSQADLVELTVDLLFLLQSLQEAAGGAGGVPSMLNMQRVVFPPRGDPGGEKPTSGALQDAASTLVLVCSRAGSAVSCGSGGVHLTHTPFMALDYR